MNANKTKNFQFAIEIGGLDQFLVQEVEGISKGFEEIQHGGKNTVIKNPGKVVVGDVTLKKMVSSTSITSEGWNWLGRVGNTALGTYNPSSNFKKDIVIKILDPTGVFVVERLVLVNCWVKTVNVDTLNRMGEDNLFENVVLSVEDIYRIG